MGKHHRSHHSHRPHQNPSPSPPPPPPPPKRNDSYHSRYVAMLLEQDDIPPLHNILAAFFVWLLLAGFLVFPGTFTSIKESIDKTEEDADWWDDDDARARILRSVRNMPLLVVAAVLCGVAAAGMAVLALRHRANYVWLVNRLLMPGSANSLAGLISTLVGVYTQHGGTWSITAKVTAIVEGTALGICAALFILIERFLLSKVKKHHHTHYDAWYGKPQRISDEYYEKEDGRTRPTFGPGNMV